MVPPLKKEVSAEQKAKLLDRFRLGLSPSAAMRYAGVTRANFQAAIDEDDDFAEAVEAATAMGQVAKAGGKAGTSLPIPPPPRSAPAPPPSVPPPLVTGGETAWVDTWTRIRREAAKLAPGESGQLRWVEGQCVKAGLHPLDRQWLWHFDQFYASKKRVDVGRFGLRAAKSDSNCRALAAEVLMTPRHLEPGFVGVCPVMSSNMSEADDRFDTIVQVLAACGLTDNTGSREKGDSNGFQRSGGGSSARVISLRDAQGFRVEFRIYPASISGAAGFTGIAGLCDEVDLWGKEAGANPAKRVFEVLFARYLTQPKAKLHVMSASYHPDSEHAKMIAAGDTPLQRVARLGEEGARIDTEARARLAVSIGSHDPLLLTPADPRSTDIPCWVSNPIAPIEECYSLAKDVKRMLFLYGGRLNPMAGRAASMALEDLRALAERNRELCNGPGRRGELMGFDDLPPWDPRSRRRMNNGGGEPSI